MHETGGKQEKPAYREQLAWIPAHNWNLPAGQRLVFLWLLASRILGKGSQWRPEAASPALQQPSASGEQYWRHKDTPEKKECNVRKRVCLTVINPCYDNNFSESLRLFGAIAVEQMPIWWPMQWLRRAHPVINYRSKLQPSDRIGSSLGDGHSDNPYYKAQGGLLCKSWKQTVPATASSVQVTFVIRTVEPRFYLLYEHSNWKD